jgi:IS30 family transposase
MDFCYNRVCKDNHRTGVKTMCYYIHLTRIEREKIMLFVSKGYSITKIALELGRNKSTISRELRCNTVNNFYQPADA